jgi:hypothetical protein
MEEQALVVLNQEQALAVFNQAAEQMRFYRSHQWQITYYAVIAYAALATAPRLVRRGAWRGPVSGVALLLVIGAAWQAGRTLWYSEDLRLTEQARQVAARKQHLSLIDGIYENYQPTERWERPLSVWMPPRPRFPWGLVAAVALGAALAIMIIVGDFLSAPAPRPPTEAQAPPPTS